MAVRTRKRRHARLRAAGLGRRCECWGDLGEHQQAVDGLGEQERGKSGRGRTRDYERGRSGSSGWLRLAQRPGLQIGSAQ